METTARYIIVGLFALVVTVAGFSFVYWLNNSSLSDMAYYRIRFDRPVIGLRQGSAVVFNGVRVGEVRKVQLNDADPKQVVTLIAIDRSTPVRTDTRVDVDSQGLMGSTILSMSGGESGAPRFPAGGHEPPLLIAPYDAGQSLTQAAKDTLRAINNLVGENAGRVQSTIANIDTFAAALARNSGRVDGILAGLERMTGGGPPKPIPRSYALTLPPFPATLGPIEAQVAVPDASGLLVFDTQKILTSAQPGRRDALEEGQWSDTIPKLVSAALAEVFDSGGFRNVAKGFEGFASEYQIQPEIRSFEIVAGQPPEGLVALSIKIVRAGHIVASRTFAAKVTAKSLAAEDASAAIDEAFGKVAADVLVWARTEIKT